MTVDYAQSKPVGATSPQVRFYFHKVRYKRKLWMASLVTRLGLAYYSSLCDCPYEAADLICLPGSRFDRALRLKSLEPHRCFDSKV